MAATRPRILHLFAAFDADLPEAARTARLIDALGKKADHAIVSDDRERRSAARLLKSKASWPAFPPLKGSRLPGRLMKLSAAMQGYDLICTYGAGALDAAMAHTLFADVHKLPPLVHHELDVDPADPGAKWYRRFALGRTAALVVATRAGEQVALGAWDQPRTRVRLVPGGIDTRGFAAHPKRDALPGLVKRKDELWLGAFAGESAQPLLSSLAKLPPEWQLVVIDAGERRTAMLADAEALGIEDRVHFTAADPSRPDLFGLLDLVAFPPDRATAIEAMAAQLAVLAPRGSEAAEPLASDNGPHLVDIADPETLLATLRHLATHPDERKRIGKANRHKAREEFDEGRMVERMWALYRGLTGADPQAGDDPDRDAAA